MKQFDVIVVGGGNSAGQAAVYLSRRAAPRACGRIAARALAAIRVDAAGSEHRRHAPEHGRETQHAADRAEGAGQEGLRRVDQRQAQPGRLADGFDEEDLPAVDAGSAPMGEADAPTSAEADADAAEADDLFEPKAEPPPPLERMSARELIEQARAAARASAAARSTFSLSSTSGHTQ